MDTARPVTSAGGPQSPGRVLMACWFGRALLGPVREQIRALAVGQGLHDDQSHRFVLAVHEAVTNVVRHGGGHGQLLLWRRAGHVWCEISDHGPGFPATVLSAAEVTGLAVPAWSGLQIIQRACTGLDITTDSTGTRLLLSHRAGPLPAP
ncbi:ATP-binding protein [Actinoplanes sp. NPDC020271]|uniref:ATP-binding protein n=1 Tax=Actinoplanes sp. NPDC020271 TaxID=3363896 RepID=UPI00379DE1B5